MLSGARIVQINKAVTGNDQAGEEGSGTAGEEDDEEEAAIAAGAAVAQEPKAKPRVRKKPPALYEHVHGPIALGNIIHSPSSPEYPINEAKPLPIKAYEVEKSPWQDTITSKQKFNGNVFTQFAQVTGVGTNVGLHRKQTQMFTYKVQRMITRHFRLSKAYVEESLYEEAVRSYFVDNKCREPAYMITDAMIAKGITVHETSEKSYGGKAGVGIDATAGEVPVQLGVKGGADNKQTERLQFESLSDCVFAYQLSKIVVWRNSDKKIETSDYNKGELYSDDASIEILADEGFETEGVEEEDVGATDMG
ncbi:MAG: hypothetical protein MMC33_010015 [Icmadophila ericetorum]|nr:hypothetical protein [Icmadophila ericetorum]